MAFLPLALAATGLATLGFGLYSRRNLVARVDGTSAKTDPRSDWVPAPNATRADPFPDGVKPGPLPIPVPVIAPNAAPATKKYPGIDVQANLSAASVGQSIQVVYEYVAGYKDPSDIGMGGGDSMPLVWLSPDRSWGAVLWNQHPAYEADFTAGDILYVRHVVLPT